MSLQKTSARDEYALSIRSVTAIAARMPVARQDPTCGVRVTENGASTHVEVLYITCGAKTLGENTVLHESTQNTERTREKAVAAALGGGGVTAGCRALSSHCVCGGECCLLSLPSLAGVVDHAVLARAI